SSAPSPLREQWHHPPAGAARAEARCRRPRSSPLLSCAQLGLEEGRAVEHDDAGLYEAAKQLDTLPIEEGHIGQIERQLGARCERLIARPAHLVDPQPQPLALQAKQAMAAGCLDGFDP